MGFLAILSVTQNDQRRVALENAAALVETREWIGVVWEKLEDGGSMNGRSGMRGTSGGEENNDQERCKMLAAGVLVQIKEVVEQYQRLMAGDLLRM
jgi:telomere length regulation protein